jgi:hydroxylamine reductase (hybrid-cluster protein)
MIWWTSRSCSSKPKEPASNIYHHGEMLPTNAYPELKRVRAPGCKFRAVPWWKQAEEFDAFGGPILMTTNCHHPGPGQLPRSHLHDRNGRLSGCTPHR